jgi:hypothetical protein
MTSSAVAEIEALFINSGQNIPAKYTVEEMGHKQTPTPIQSDNITALRFFTMNLQSKATKLIDM